MKKGIGLILILLVVFSITNCARKKVVEPTPLPEEETVMIPPEEEVVEEEEMIAPLSLQSVYFDLDRSEIRPEAAAILKENARQLREHSDVNILIEGHCCELGTDEYNLALGERRAMAVKRYLVSLGIDPNRLSTLSYGEEQPLDPNNLPINRRCEFKIR